MGCFGSKNQVDPVYDEAAAAAVGGGNISISTEGYNALDSVAPSTVRRELSAESRHTDDSGYKGQPPETETLRQISGTNNDDEDEGSDAAHQLQKTGFLLQRSLTRTAFGVSFELSEVDGEGVNPDGETTVKRAPRRLARLERQEKKQFTDKEIEEKLDKAMERKKEIERLRLLKIQSLTSQKSLQSATSPTPAAATATATSARDAKTPPPVSPEIKDERNPTPADEQLTFQTMILTHNEEDDEQEKTSPTKVLISTREHPASASSSSSSLAAQNNSFQLIGKLPNPDVNHFRPISPNNSFNDEHSVDRRSDVLAESSPVRRSGKIEESWGGLGLMEFDRKQEDSNGMGSNTSVKDFLQNDARTRGREDNDDEKEELHTMRSERPGSGESRESRRSLFGSKDDKRESIDGSIAEREEYTRNIRTLNDYFDDELETMDRPQSRELFGSRPDTGESAERESEY